MKRGWGGGKERQFLGTHTVPVHMGSILDYTNYIDHKGRHIYFQFIVFDGDEDL